MTSVMPAQDPACGMKDPSFSESGSSGPWPDKRREATSVFGRTWQSLLRQWHFVTKPPADPFAHPEVFKHIIAVRISVVTGGAALVYGVGYAVLPFPVEAVLCTVALGLNALLALAQPFKPGERFTFGLLLGISVPCWALSFVLGRAAGLQLCYLWCAVLGVLMLRSAASASALVALNLLFFLLQQFSGDTSVTDWDAISDWCGFDALAHYSVSVLVVVGLLCCIAVRYGQAHQDQLAVRFLRLSRLRQKEREKSLQATGEAKTAFLAMMSHELRTPLNGIVGFSELLVDGLRDDSANASLAQTIQSSSLTLLTIINKVLEFSRVNDGHGEVELAAFDVRALVEGATTALYPLAAKQNIELMHFINVPDNVTVQGDAERLRQVLTNLLGNALKFTEVGFVKLSVELRRATDQLVFSVKDTGIGIEPEALSRIFDPFQQAKDKRTRRKYDGTGLGLSISRSLARKMGGELTVTSEERKGSVFTLTVPAHTGTPGIATPESVLNRRTTEEVLLLDSLPAHADVLAQQLSAHGIGVRQFGDVEALMGAPDGACNALATVVDVRCLEQGGADLRDLEARLGVPVVALTSSLDMETVDSPSRLVLRKPVNRRDLDELIAKLRNAQSASRSNSPVMSPTVENSRQPAASHAARPDIEVLLVEDNAVNTKVICRMLDRVQVRYRCEENGRDGVMAYSAKAPTLVLMDCHMPVMDGFDAAEAIRLQEQSTGAPRVPIVAVTADTFSSAKILASGMDSYLLKPVRMQGLVDVLEKYCPPPRSDSVHSLLEEGHEVLATSY